MTNDLIRRQALYEILDEYDEGKIYWGEAEDRIGNLPSAQPVFSELCATELTCEGCKWEKNGQDLCYECCRGCGDMYEEREGNG